MLGHALVMANQNRVKMSYPIVNCVPFMMIGRWLPFSMLHLRPEKNMRPLILYLLVVFANLASAQSRILDSLRAALKNHPQEDTLRVVILNELSLRILKNQPKQSLAYAEHALRLAQRLKFE